MNQFVVETVSNAEFNYRIRIDSSEREITVPCNVGTLVTLQQCIERALSKPNLSSCQLGEDQAIAFSPQSNDAAASYRIVLTVTEETVSITATEDQLEEFVEAEIQPILDRT